MKLYIGCLEHFKVIGHDQIHPETMMDRLIPNPQPPLAIPRSSKVRLLRDAHLKRRSPEISVSGIYDMI
jgi:hypothetical protein